MQGWTRSGVCWLGVGLLLVGSVGCGSKQVSTTLDLRGEPLTEAEIQERIAQSPQVTLIELDPEQISDGVLQALRESQKLHAINIAQTANGERPTNLEEVGVFYLDGTKVSDEGVKEVTAMPNLKTLSLNFTSVTNQALQEVAKLENLAELDLSDTAIDDEGLKELAGIKKLSLLWLSNTPVTDAGLQHLAKAKTLTQLWLTSTAVTDVGLVELAKLNRLSTLILNETKVTEEGVDELRQSLPGCQIFVK